MSRLFIPKDYWEQIIPNYISETHVKNILRYYEKEYAMGGVIPSEGNVFKALDYTGFKNVSIVILGQDPYPDPKNATGLAFSSRDNVKRPQSLDNIVEELDYEYGKNFVDSGGNDLIHWTRQGVLLLNTILTLKSINNKNVHTAAGSNDWKHITMSIIKALDKYSKTNNKPIVFMLWGTEANDIGKKCLVGVNVFRLVLSSTHPSRQSYQRSTVNLHSFKGNGHFKQANAFLKKNNANVIDWSI